MYIKHDYKWSVRHPKLYHVCDLIFFYFYFVPILITPDCWESLQMATAFLATAIAMCTVADKKILKCLFAQEASTKEI